MDDGVNVLSLFDGISCGQIALKRAKIKVNNYFASEIDKNAIKVTQYNWPNTIQIGDVTKLSIKSFFLSEVDSIFSVNGINDTNLQDIIPEWEMLYWLNKEFSISTTIRTQESDEKLGIQSSSLQRIEEIRFSKCGVGDIIRTRNIEGCRASRDFSDQKQYTELQCGEWWYVYRSYSRNSEKNFGGINGEEGFRGNKGKTSEICNSTVSIERIKNAGIGENQNANEQPSVEKKISGWAEKDRYEEEEPKETRDGGEEKSNPLSNFKKELQKWDEINGTIKNNGDFLSIYPKTQITVVKYENGIIIFNGIFQILLAGSPCQGFSFAGKQLNFEDPRSKLFFEFVRLLKETKPRYFLLENVLMKKEFSDIISTKLNVEPIEINSNLVSCQNRRRLYWTNIPNIKQPIDKNILIKDVIYDDNYKIFTNERIIKTKKTTKNYIKWDTSGKGYWSQQDRAYFKNGKMCSLTRCNPTDKLNIVVDLENGIYRRMHPIEAERCQNVPDNYTDVSGISSNRRFEMLGNGWTVDVIAHIFGFLPEKFKE